MGTKDKLIQRFISMPKDFTWEEMNKLLTNFGYEQSNKGKTSGSRVVFKNSKYIPIMLHKPHPGNIIKEYVMKQVLEYLREEGLLKIITIMNTLKYKDFIGTVGFSENDNVFFGKVEGINGLVTFEGESVKELQQSFQEAVDDYIAYCEAEGIKPHKTFSGSLNVRISPETHIKAAMLAKQAGISINAFIRNAVEKQIAAML